MARAIVRFSIQSGQVRLRNQVRNALEAAGFTRIGTSSFESPDAPLGELTPALTALLGQLSTSRLDHLWIYVDKPDDEPMD